MSLCWYILIYQLIHLLDIINVKICKMLENSNNCHLKMYNIQKLVCSRLFKSTYNICLEKGLTIVCETLSDYPEWCNNGWFLSFLFASLYFTETLLLKCVPKVLFWHIGLISQVFSFFKIRKLRKHLIHKSFTYMQGIFVGSSSFLSCCRHYQQWYIKHIYFLF